MSWFQKSLRAFAQFPKTLISMRYNQTAATDDERFTHFGFQKVKEHEKSKKVREVFDEVSNKYDVMNDVMSLGTHRLWKDILMDRLSPTQDTQLLDVAGGTGDIAFRFLNYIINAQCQKDCHVTVVDINPAMLKVGEARSHELGYDPNFIKWQEGDAENLSFANDSFNAYSIAFGIRNCTHIDQVVREAYRVLRPGGRFICLEFSQLENSMVQWLYDQYSFQVIPVLGQLIVGKWQPYQYLVESIRQFPNQENFKAIIEAAGFRQVSYENLNMGIVAIHSGFKL